MPAQHRAATHEHLFPPKNSPHYNIFHAKRRLQRDEEAAAFFAASELSDISEERTSHKSGSSMPSAISTGPAPDSCCAIVPLAATAEVEQISVAISKALHIRQEVRALECSMACAVAAPPGCEVFTLEHLADFIDVFRRRLERQRRVAMPDRYKMGEAQCLLGELEELRRQERELFEEVRGLKRGMGRGTMEERGEAPRVWHEDGCGEYAQGIKVQEPPEWHGYAGTTPVQVAGVDQCPGLGLGLEEHVICGPRHWEAQYPHPAYI